MSLLNSTIVDRKKQNHALELKLTEIDRAKKADMRMFDNMKQRFRNKYGINEQEHKRPSTVADIRMYESHCPGFCYHRDGRARFSNDSSITEETMNLKELSNLLFTNGELDSDKVLCLHLLSSHRCETLKPPPKQQRAMSVYVREQSPLEQLIERSKKYTSQNKNQLIKKLPIYVLNVTTRPDERPSSVERKGKTSLIRDGRLATRLLINNDIRKLIEVILEALQTTNPEKMKELLNRARNPELLKRIFIKPEIIDFVNTLSGFKFLSCCDSFHLSRPFKTATSLNIDCGISSVAKLVTEIRQNVLRNPNIPRKKLKKSTNMETSDGPKPIFQRYQIDNGSSLILTQRSFDVQTFAHLLREKTREANERDMREYRKTLDTISEDSENFPDEEDRSLLVEEATSSSTRKSQCRRSMCIACQEKWKQPLPKYKYVSKKKSNEKLNKEVLNSIISKSTHLLTMIIDDEMEKMKQKKILSKEKANAKEEAYKKDLVKTNSHFNKTKFYQIINKPGKESSVVDSLNLAKIKHAIAVKENTKRVQKFLEQKMG